MRKNISDSGLEKSGGGIEGSTQLIKSKVAILDDANSVKIEEEVIHKMEIIWRNVIGMVILHSMAFYGLYLGFTEARVGSNYCNLFFGIASGLGVSAGSHRLWSHRSFKATLPMRILLMLMNTCANEDAIYYWVRDHRVHHKYTDSNADPYNSSRGFFFAHMGWLMVKKHPDVTKRGKGIDLSDLNNDPVVTFQKKYYYVMMSIICFIIPTAIPMYLFDESLRVAFFLAIFRYVVSLHLVWCTNSVAHTFGYKPFDIFSTATDYSLTGIIMLGENWHNYHHTFPWDYTTPEIPFFTFNPTAKFIEFFSWFGLTYDLKTVSLDLAMKQAGKKGDGTFVKSKIYPDSSNDDFSHKNTVWGWNDEDLKPEDKNGTEIHAKSDT